ncbi:hypothetical protein GUJ93_ZPchr0003g17735 [Zizania palustris]|uniref:Kazal-like domain-containing protein n=1 Tax=Zizania palustris TaxID=103762 RepID=A0A8J5VDP5_ZIZPA|nr:hypothetical protein GUJ93_ZPchr0003g17735 [Zizania palustris]
MAASGRCYAAAPTVSAVAAVCVVLLLTSAAVQQAAAQVPCGECDQACKSSCEGSGSGSCSSACADPSNEAGCKSCMAYYYQKCVNYCGSSCRATCVSG